MAKLEIDGTTLINAPGKNVRHTVTSFQNGFTGLMYWTVFNGIRVVSLSIKANSTGGGQIVYSSLPKCGQYAAATTADNSNAYFINNNDTVLRANINTTVTHTFQMVYPVASDWEES